jgi:hypothetical protein
MDGPNVPLDLTIHQGCDASYGPYIWATGDQTSPFSNFTLSSYYNFTGAIATWTVRQFDFFTSAIVGGLQYSSTGGQITYSTLQAPQGPAAPATPNAFGWSIPNSIWTAPNPVPGKYYHTLIIQMGSLKQLYFKGRFEILGAQ